MLSISELLSLRGLDTSRRIKLLRHQDSQYDMVELHHQGPIEIYQSYQSNPSALRSCEMVVSFLGQAGTRARFHGVYRVVGERPARERPLPANFPYPTFFPPEGYHYGLEKQSGFEDFEGRVVIDWGPATGHPALSRPHVALTGSRTGPETEEPCIPSDRDVWADDCPRRGRREQARIEG